MLTKEEEQHKCDEIIATLPARVQEALARERRNEATFIDNVVMFPWFVKWHLQIWWLNFDIARIERKTKKLQKRRLMRECAKAKYVN
jgi:hypothetical protein